MIRRMRIAAPAKVNLRLVILRREESGYHSLETIFCGIGLSDQLDLEIGDSGINLEVLGNIETGPLEENLVYLAANRFYDATGELPKVRITLDKRIPSGGGLGGGSSDAAATLKALNEMYDRPLSQHRLQTLGSDLGSDVPFFLSSTPLALAWGRGERLLELTPLPSRQMVIAHPGPRLSTPVVFKKLGELREGVASVEPVSFAADSLSSWGAIRELAVNDFEMVAFGLIPSLPLGARSLVEAGATVALLAGSGSSIFGIFENAEAADRSGQQLASIGMKTWRSVTLSDWPTPEAQD
jgi:4-diphosphocytidyl-2-C-methyl-D-erythritol kinase